ncbi:hypothetical protein QMK52_24250 [Pseudomonas sp. P9_2]|uniref:hypothetical protein n=1 Tax=Pseudomonas sp. P9_2 TaxID=3043447 RepID=UPI002A36B6DB|nr:hypothetical protein [Pseudomonas sp. P9_2]WPN51988.1 hypothetical protein QMK52_24250 [Pseudomonas sp. P9_2]
MPVDLRALPEKLPLPAPLRHRRWCLMVLLGAMLVGALVALLWPQGHWQTSLWFWCCVVILPVIPGLLIYALRLLAYERHSDYAQSWNRSLEEQEQVLVRQGQRTVGLLATSYCTAVGNNLIAQALRLGSKSLQPVYLKSQAQTMRLSQLVPYVQEHTQAEYAQRLALYLRQVLAGLEPDLQRYVRDQPLRVRIRHNQVLSDEKVLSLWRLARQNEQSDDQVFFATQDDGLMWLDAWLDQPERYRLLLSLEINLFLEPVSEQAESVSAVLLASADECAVQTFVPTAWVHRPVRMDDPDLALKDAFLWGRLLESQAYMTWLTQIPGEVWCDASIVLSTLGYPLDVARCHTLDDSFGLPGAAVGNVALVLAGEQAHADRQAQVVMLQDTGAQVFVVQPV